MPNNGQQVITNNNFSIDKEVVVFRGSYFQGVQKAPWHWLTIECQACHCRNHPFYYHKNLLLTKIQEHLLKVKLLCKTSLFSQKISRMNIFTSILHRSFFLHPLDTFRLSCHYRLNNVMNPRNKSEPYDQGSHQNNPIIGPIGAYFVSIVKSFMGPFRYVAS